MHTEKQAASLYESCGRLEPAVTDYVDVPLEAAFNWAVCLGEVPFDELFLVVFRSVRRPTADSKLLWELDEAAYAEARAAGGLLHYFRGGMDERRRCLSFCLWESAEHARSAVGRMAHDAAAEIWPKMYEHYALERYALKKLDGGLVFEPLGARHARRPVNA